MNCSLEYLLKDCNRLILLLWSCEEAEKRQKHLDDLSKNIEDIRKMYHDKDLTS